MHHQPADGVAWEVAPTEHFTGRAWFGPLHSPVDAEDLNVLGVRFEAGARTDWHSHPAGQALYIVAGVARVQHEGGETVEAGPGDVVHAPAGELHWHGAGPSGEMTHLSITHGGATRWSDRKVSDEEYARPADATRD